MYGYYKEKSHVNHFWASGSFNRIWRCYENVVSGHLTSADQELYHDNSIEAMKKKTQFYWSISGNTTVLRHLRVFPVVCGRCDVFRPIYNFRCNCSVLGVFIIKLLQLLLFLRWQLNNRKLTGNRWLHSLSVPLFLLQRQATHTHWL